LGAQARCGGGIIDEGTKWTGLLAAVAVLAAPIAPVVAIAGAALGFAVAIRLYEMASGIVVPRRLTLGVAAYAAFALIFGEYLDGYEALPWLDLALHATSAWVLAIVGMALALLPTAGAPPRTPVWILSTLAFGFALMVGAMWEVMEFALDATIGTNTQDTGLDDTMWDVVANLAGALAGTVAGHVAVRSGVRVPGGGLLLDFVRQNPVIYGAWTGPVAQGEVRGGLAGADGALDRGG
jgi:hypothetical protein